MGNSLVGRAVSTVATRIRDVTEKTSAVVQGSFLYRWLTAEPEPEVVVIDLRETYTVGPFIRLLDAAIDWVAPYWQESTVKRFLDWTIGVGERFAETRVGQMLVAVLAPPEPPAQADRELASDGGEPPEDD